MSTEYYLQNKESKEWRPLGRSSVGWTFAFHPIPEWGIGSYEDFMLVVISDLYLIMDEYDRVITWQEFDRIVRDRKTSKDWDSEWYNRGYYYKSEHDFHISNNSCRGPNGLLRRNLSEYVIGYGEGTWDLVLCYDNGA